jgi:hypothetical protein
MPASIVNLSLLIAARETVERIVSYRDPRDMLHTLYTPKSIILINPSSTAHSQSHAHGVSSPA